MQQLLKKTQNMKLNEHLKTNNYFNDTVEGLVILRAKASHTKFTK